MPDQNGHLYLFEALELRDDYDRRVRLLEKLLAAPERDSQRGFGFVREVEELRPAQGFEPERAEAELKKIKTRRLKLNQEIQAANFGAKISFDGEQISLSQALEVRKTMRAELEQVAGRVVDAAYARVLHKEERDIVKEPVRLFARTFAEHDELLRSLRRLVTAIQGANHAVTVSFRDE
jgi:uncharacterized protein YdcH (DUF465 family)